jgi:hypothetical protein
VTLSLRDWDGRKRWQVTLSEVIASGHIGAGFREWASSPDGHYLACVATWEDGVELHLLYIADISVKLSRRGNGDASPTAGGLLLHP